MNYSAVVVLLMVGAVCGQWESPVPAWQQPSTTVNTARQYQSQDGTGQATFGYSHPGQAAVTHRDANGHQRGSYAYIDPEGKEVRISYIADADGFRIISNDQAIAPQPSYQPVGSNFLQETPEVAAARAAHMAAHAAALAAAAKATPVKQENERDWDDQSWNTPKKSQKQQWAPAPQRQQQQQGAFELLGDWNTPVQQDWNAPRQQTWNVPQQQTWNLPQQSVIPQVVQDTPEVAAAKAEFFRAYSQAAALAAEKPE